MQFFKHLSFVLFLLSTLIGFSQDQPNIILIMADDLGYGDVGFNGNPIIKTPHMDALAHDGLIFTNFYAGGPVCSPTRGTVLTGRHYSRYGIFSAIGALIVVSNFIAIFFSQHTNVQMMITILIILIIKFNFR